MTVESPLQKNSVSSKLSPSDKNADHGRVIDTRPTILIKQTPNSAMKTVEQKVEPNIGKRIFSSGMKFNTTETVVINDKDQAKKDVEEVKNSNSQVESSKLDGSPNMIKVDTK